MLERTRYENPKQFTLIHYGKFKHYQELWELLTHGLRRVASWST